MFAETQKLSILYMPSNIYDSISTIKHVSVVFFWVKISTHYEEAAFLTKWLVCFVFLSANNQHKLIICPYVWKPSTWKWLGHVSSLVMCNVWVTNSFIGTFDTKWIHHCWVRELNQLVRQRSCWLALPTYSFVLLSRSTHVYNVYCLH